MEAIKNCRKCGRPGRIKDTFARFRRGWVGCPVCKIYFHWVHDPKDAVKKWNEEQETGHEGR